MDDVKVGSRHHVGLNSWSGRRITPRRESGRGARVHRAKPADAISPGVRLVKIRTHTLHASDEALEEYLSFKQPTLFFAASMDSLSEAERRRAQNRENLRAHYGLARANTPLSPLSDSTPRLELPQEGKSNEGKVSRTDTDALDLGRAVSAPLIGPGR